MNKAILWCIRNPVFANLVFIGIVVGGLVASLQINRELFPVLPTDLIEVRVVYPDFQAKEIEEAICVKIEEALQGISGIEEIQSKAREAIGIVTITVASNADADKVLDDVKIRVDAIDNFPEDIEKPQVVSLVARPKIIDFVIYGEASTRTLKQLSQEIKNDLSTQTGIAGIQVLGVPEYEIAIEVSESALEKYHLTFDQIIAAVKSSSFNIAGGSLKTTQGKMNIQIENRMYTGDEYRNIVLVSNLDGTRLLLKDVAEVRDSFVEEEEVFRVGKSPAVLFSIFAADNTNTVKAADRIKNYIEKKKQGLSKIDIMVWEDPSLEVIERQNMLLKNIFMGSVLIIIGLGLFLNLGLSFWVTMGIPISFAGGILVLWLVGHTINLLSLFALIVVLGIVVDDAIVVAESIFNQSEKGANGEEAAYLGTTEVATSILAAVLTTMIAFLPLYFLPGTSGHWGSILATTVIVILVFSLFESFFILPAHLKHISQDEKSAVRSFFDRQMDRATKIYQYFFEWCIDHSIVVVSFAIVMIMASLVLFKTGQVKVQFNEQPDANSYTAEITFPPSVPFSTTRKYTEYVAEMAMELNEKFEEKLVERTYFYARENRGMVGVKFAPAEDRSLHSAKIVERWQDVVGEVPDISSLYFRSSIENLGGAPIDIKVTSSSLVTLRKVLPLIRKELAQYEGVYNIKDNMSLGTLEIQPKLREEGRIIGISEQSLGKQLFQGFAGEKAIVLQRGQDEVEVVVRYSKENRGNISSLQELQTTGNTSLSTVTDWEIVSGLEEIHRENRRRLLTITADIYQYLTNSHHIIRTLKEDFFQKLKTEYPDIEIRFGGEEQESEKFEETASVGMIYVFMFIFGILALTSGSFLQPAIVMSVVPFGVIGAIFGHWLWGAVMTNISFFGVIALSGIVVNDSLVFIEQINREIRKGYSVIQSVKRAGPARFRAIVLTTLTTVLGLLPFLFETSLQAKIFIPMALSIGFGIFWATFLTLFLLPVLFLYFNTMRCCFSFVVNGKWPSREIVEPAFKHRPSQSDSE